MGINWKIAFGKMGETLATKEDEYRKFATDWFTTEHKNRSEKMSAYNTERKSELREIDRNISLLRAEGIDDKIIGNAINTYGKNAFQVLATNLDNFKKKENVYGYLKKNDKLKRMFNDNFAQLIESGGKEMSYDIDLNRMKMTLLTEPPDFADIPNIPESQFGFSYTGGIRESIADIGKDAQIPEYDQRPAPVTGIGEMFTMGLTDIPSEANFKNQGDLRRAIVDKLKAAYNGLVYNETSQTFVPRFEQNAKENTFLTDVNRKFNEIKTKYLNQRPDVAPGELRDIEEGAMTDQQLLDSVVTSVGLSVGSENPYTNQDDKTKTVTAVTSDAFTDSMKLEIQNNSNSNATAIYKILQSGTAGLSVQQQQSIAQMIGQGIPLAKIIQDLNITLPPAIRNQLNRAESALQQSDRDIISGHAGTAGGGSSSAQQQQGSKKLSAPIKQQQKRGTAKISGRTQRNVIINQKEMDAWDDIYGPHFNPDGTPKNQMTDQELQALLIMLQGQFKQKYPNLTL